MAEQVARKAGFQDVPMPMDGVCFTVCRNTMQGIGKSRRQNVLRCGTIKAALER